MVIDVQPGGTAYLTSEIDFTPGAQLVCVSSGLSYRISRGVGRSHWKAGDWPPKGELTLLGSHHGPGTEQEALAAHPDFTLPRPPAHLSQRSHLLHMRSSWLELAHTKQENSGRGWGRGPRVWIWGWEVSSRTVVMVLCVQFTSSFMNISSV